MGASVFQQTDFNFILFKLKEKKKTLAHDKIKKTKKKDQKTKLTAEKMFI